MTTCFISVYVDLYVCTFKFSLYISSYGIVKKCIAINSTMENVFVYWRVASLMFIAEINCFKTTNCGTFVFLSSLPRYLFVCVRALLAL